ncbi:MAG: N-acetylmuramoyl-L-alanine amidase [Solobacterium sp.]|nr:N-acetylmuramoyl-L-alanine amidase [Solobacterium sp.]
MSNTKSKHRKSKKKSRTFKPLRLLFLIAVMAVFGYGVYRASQVIIPKPFVVVLDPVLGGGAKGLEGYVNEADYAEHVVGLLNTKFEEQHRIEAVLTHTPDREMSVEQRAAMINELDPDLVLSIRCDYSPDENESGMVIYADPANRTSRRSMDFAQTIAEQFENSEWYPYEVKTGYMYFHEIGDNRYEPLFKEEKESGMTTWPLMEQTDPVTVICSALFVTNETESQFMTTEEAYENAADLYMKAILQYAGENR